MKETVGKICLVVLGLFLSLDVVSAPSLDDRVQMESFFDGLWYAQKEQHHLVGSVVVVIQGNETLLSKGYGSTEPQTEEYVSPDQTLFRIGSISKVLTWIALLQLQEQGRVDLDRDINTYLKDFQLPSTFEEPITTRHLMNHTAGFEDLVLNLGFRSPEQLLPLGEYLATHLPQRVRRPGEFSAYSNHGAALAAQIVAELSGMPWSDYVEQNILAPLAMSDTVVRHPMSAKQQESLAPSYSFGAGQFKSQEPIHWNIYPAAIASSTGEDMTQLMRGLLGVSSQSILKQESLSMLYQAGFRHDPVVNGWRYGFIEANRNGQNIFGHSGAINSFHSQMWLLPEHQLGIFISHNTEGGAAAARQSIAAFLNYYFPVASGPNETNPASTDLSQYTGQYLSLRRNWSDFSRLASLLAGIEISATSDGSLLVGGGSATRFYPAPGGHFVTADGARKLAFKADASGRATHFFLSDRPTAAFERVGTTASPTFFQVLFALSALPAVIFMIYWPLRGLFRLLRRNRGPSLPLYYYAPAWSLCVAIIYSLLQLVGVLGDREQFYYQVPEQVDTLMTLILLASIGAVLLVIPAVRSWGLRLGDIAERINYSVVACAGLLFAWLSWYWNLLS